MPATASVIVAPLSSGIVSRRPIGGYDADRISMRSPRGFVAAVVFLLALPVSLLYTMVVGVGSEIAIHAALGLGSMLMAFAVFDFRTSRWIAWVGCVSAGSLAAIFLLQGVSELIPNAGLTQLAYQALE